MTFRMRTSKFRHVFGKERKREECYDSIRITRNAWDSPFCDVNPRFVAVVLEAQGGGAFTVINIENTGRLDLNAPRVCGHTAAVLDLQFCPFNDYVIASGSEDCTVKVWELPEGGLTDNMTEPVVDLVGHQRRVGIVQWHPTAENMLFSAGFDYMIYGWNVGTGESVVEIACHTDTIYSMSFNWDGSLFATTSKDKKLRVINARTGDVVQEGKSHTGAKPSRVAWCGAMNKLFTTGFSRMNERQYALWDSENLTDLDGCLKFEMIDTSSGVLFPTYDPDTNMVYVAGKGDGNIRYFEIAMEKPFVHYLETFRSPKPQRGLCYMPKRGLNVGECEVARVYKLTAKNSIDVIVFTVPRKATTFQTDIFPPTKADVAVVSAEDWLSGTDAEPKLVSLKDGYTPPARAKLEVSEKAKQATSQAEEKDGPPKGEKELLKAWHAQKQEIEDLKKQLATANIKIRTLETQLADSSA